MISALLGCDLRDRLMERADTMPGVDVPMTYEEMRDVCHFASLHDLSGSLDGSMMLRHKDDHGPAYSTYRVFQIPNFELSQALDGCGPNCLDMSIARARALERIVYKQSK